MRIKPNDAALVRLAGTLLIEQNDEWLVGRRYLLGDSLQAVLAKAADGDRILEVSALPAARSRDHPDDGLTPHIGA